MCGIAGIVGSFDSQNLQIVKKMTDAMVLRGPDGEGLWSQENVFLGHRRLSIIDIANGKQPMETERNGVKHAIVFNGEIYNYKHIINILRNQGVSFKTNSDTEALLLLLMHTELFTALNKLNGMFSFSWWDGSNKRLVLARDRMGIKPLYYYYDSSGFLTFSSTLESIIKNPKIELKLNMEALGYYLTLGYPPSPLTMYSNIHELPPGRVLVWEAGKIDIKTYWEIDWNNKFTGTEDEAAEHLDKLLDEVMRDHLVSDVPVGAFLSGGIDSSAVVARANRYANSNFNTFTVSFPDQAYDESYFAELVARHVGVNNTIIPMESLPIDENTCRFVLKQIGQPFIDSSCLPTYLVSKAASQEVKVVLSGDGGDELFAGYEFFDWGNKINKYKSLPDWIRRLTWKGLNSIKNPIKFGNSIRQIKKGLEYSLDSQEEMIIHLKSTIDPDKISSISTFFEREKLDYSRIRTYLNNGKGLNFINALSRFLTEIDLPGDMLRKVDNMSMAASIEVRVPLLDYRIVEFAQSLPMSMKVKGGVRKAILRKVIQPDLPTEVLNHKKWGFSIPLHKTFNAQFFNFCRDMLCSSDSKTLKFFGGQNIERILNLNKAHINQIPHIWSNYTINHTLWMAIQLEVWCRDKGINLPTEFEYWRD